MALTGTSIAVCMLATFLFAQVQGRPTLLPQTSSRRALLQASRDFGCAEQACTLIIVHGLNMNKEEARSAGKVMAPEYNVIAPDISDEQLRDPDLTGAMKKLDRIVGNHARERVVLAGFSAGGQLVQRFAVGGSNKNVPMMFIIGAPRSYAYLTSYRPEPHENCPKFNVWKYGLEGTHDLDIDVQAYLGKEVLLMVGGRDNKPDGDKCQERAQGDSHLSRAHNYLHHVNTLKATRHSLQVVPGAHHNIHEVFGAFRLS